MKIKYKKKRFLIYLIGGILFMILGLISFLTTENDTFFNSSYMVFGFIYIGIAIYERQNQYLLIEENSIKQNYFFGKEMKLSEINSIRNFADEYTLKGNKKEMIINTEIIEDKSLIKLKEVLKSLEVPAYKREFN